MKGRILIVDDDADLRTTVSAALSREGFDVEEVGDGNLALDRLRQGASPDLILLDLVMEHLNGAAFLEAKESEARLARIPVIAMSGHFAPTALNHVQWMVAKPLDLDDLLAHVRMALHPAAQA